MFYHYQNNNKKTEISPTGTRLTTPCCAKSRAFNATHLKKLITPSATFFSLFLFPDKKGIPPELTYSWRRHCDQIVTVTHEQRTSAKGTAGVWSAIMITVISKKRQYPTTPVPAHTAIRQSNNPETVIIQTAWPQNHLEPSSITVRVDRSGATAQREDTHAPSWNVGRSSNV